MAEDRTLIQLPSRADGVGQALRAAYCALPSQLPADMRLLLEKLA